MSQTVVTAQAENRFSEPGVGQSANTEESSPMSLQSLEPSRPSAESYCTEAYKEERSVRIRISTL